MRVRRILDEINAAIADLDQIGQGLNGVLRIATSMFALHGALPKDLASLKNRFPGVELVFDTWPSLDIISATQRGEIDIGVFAASAPPEGLITRTYCSENVVLMIPKGHRLSGRESVDIQDLSEEDLLQLPSGTYIQQIMEEQGRRHGVRLHKSYRVGSLDAAVAITRAGHGLAIVPRSSWESLGPFQGLTITPLNPEWSRTKLLVGIKASQPTSSLAHRVFVELATQSDA
ncbi:MAG: hypothetical protein ABT05_02750 [Lautropia sp. SCN 66-9]|nr:MAG: hypothetical protein ABT05_02750 [Lautropia sp. SCN 66-9]